MRRMIVVFVAALCAAVSIAGADVRLQSPLENLRETRKELLPVSAHRETAAVDARSYRSASGLHKITVQAGDEDSLARVRKAGARELADYGSFKLFAVNQPQLDALAGGGERGSGDRGQGTGGSDAELSALTPDPRLPTPALDVRDDFNVLLLRSGMIDTTADENFSGVEKSLATGEISSASTSLVKKDERFTGSRLRLLQFAGPVKSAWVDELQAMGLEVIAYVPNNGYLVREDAAAHSRFERAALMAQTRGEAFVQWQGEFRDDYKIHPSLTRAAREGGEVSVAVQIARSRDGSHAKDERFAKKIANSLIVGAYTLQNFTNLKIRINAERIAELAAQPNVVNIEPWSPPRMMDERAGQIVAHELNSAGKEPKGPGYLAWLQARGFTSRFDFAIDVTDSGIDRGSTDAANLHPDFKDATGQSRLLYARDFTSDKDASDIPGHGTLNLSIAGGFNMSPESRDGDGYQHGLGTAPFAGLGASKIFLADGRFDLSEPFSNIVTQAYQSGARISSNSWGELTNAYSLDSQEYDLRARDAVPGQPGNQEIVFCFSAGNAGFNRTIGSPSTAKNVISVAASESFRKGATDGCGVKDEDADSAVDIAFFSSGGFLDDGRIKPDIAAPGSHIQGAASQHPGFDALGVCGPAAIDELYYPKGQTLYTWSSGTSHSTPIVAGAAALVRQFFLNRGEEPSAALVKAYLLNTTTYLTGARAGGDLPQSRQGWGLLNLARLFNETPKVFINQTRTFSDSGQEFVFTGEVKDSSQPFRVTLAYSDAPGFSAFAAWINNLDLEVVVNGQVYRGNNFQGDQSIPGGDTNTKDTVESVWLPAGTTGTFLVRVRATNVAGDGVPGNTDGTDQDFALVVYNGERKDVPVATFNGASVAGGSDAFADPGETVSLKVNLKDVAPFALTNASATLSTATVGVAVTTATVQMSNLAPGADGENAEPFVFTLPPTIACGTAVQFTLELSASGTTSRIPFLLTVGNARPTDFFADDVEAGETKWTHASALKKKKKRVPVDPWVITTKRVRSGASAWFAANPDVTADAHLDTLPIILPTDGRNLQLLFYHTFAFEFGGFDGAVLEISAGGEFEDLGPKMLQGKYNGKIANVSTNNLAMRDAWVEGRLGAFQAVVVDLSSYAGKTVVIRFRIASDENFKATGWYIDDVMLKGDRVTCTPIGLSN